MMASILLLAAAVLPYCGELRQADGSPVTSRTLFPVTFRLYDAPTAGTLLWSRRNAVELDANGGFYTELSDARGDALAEKVSCATLDEALARGAAATNGLWIALEPRDAQSAATRTRLAETLYAHRVGIAHAADVVDAPLATVVASDATVTGRLTAARIFANRFRLTAGSAGLEGEDLTLSNATVSLRGTVLGPHAVRGQAERHFASDAIHVHSYRDENGTRRYSTLPVPAGASGLPASSAHAGITDEFIQATVFGKE